MYRRPRGVSVGPRAALLLFAVAVSCASPTVLAPPAGTGGSGGAGGSQLTDTTALTSAGLGGSGSGGAIGSGGSGGGAPDGGSDVDAAACAPFVETFMPACMACLDVACCDVAATCFAISDCFGYASCQQNCPPSLDAGSNPCLDACAQLYPTAAHAFSALAACLHAGCAGVCPY